MTADCSDPDKRDALNFIASEALDGAPWRTIYSYKMQEFGITEDEVREEELRIKEQRSTSKTSPSQASNRQLSCTPQVEEIRLVPEEQVVTGDSTSQAGPSQASDNHLPPAPQVAAIRLVPEQRIEPGLVQLFTGLASGLAGTFGIVVVAVVLYQVLIRFPAPAHWLGSLLMSHEVNTVVLVLAYGWVFWFSLLLLLVTKFVQLTPTHLLITPQQLIAIRVRDSKESDMPKIIAAAQEDSTYAWFRDRTITLANVNWSDVRRLSVKPRRAGKSDLLCIHTYKGKTILLNIGDLITEEVRVRICEALHAAQHVQCEPEVYSLLEPRPETSYTELWLAALLSPPERRRLTPLTDGAALNDNKYIIQKRLAAGGQGTAYVATVSDSAGDDENDTSTTVILKEYILPVCVTRAAKKQAVSPLEMEARLLERLDHPRIVKLKDFFLDDHRGYLVLEHVQGTDLRTMVKKSGPLPEPKVLQLAQEMCAILSYLHSQNPPVIHRDFTADNLILAPDGVLKLIDFNVATPIGTTITATVVGKHAYMPPEQVQGKAMPQSDIYALGATLSFLLTGHEPEPLTTSHPRDCNPEISERLNEIVVRCTQLDAGARYASVTEVQLALSQVSESKIYMQFMLTWTPRRLAPF